MNTEEEKKDEISEASRTATSDNETKSQTVSPEEISSLESSPTNNSDRSSTNELSRIPNQQKSNFLNKGSKLKKRAAFISLGVSFFGVFGLVFSFFLGPLKLSVLLGGIEAKHFASSKFATEAYGEHLVANYIRKTILPNLGKECPSSVAIRKCSPNIDGENGPIKRLYQGWRNNNFEGMLAERGLEIERRGDTFKVKIDKKIDPALDFDASNIESVDITGGRKEARRAIRETLDRDLYSDSALKRFRMGGFIQKKYGVKRCLFACDKRDDFADWKDKKYTSFKMKLIERVVEPRSQYVGILFSCLVEGCSNTPDPNDPERRDAFSKKIQSKMDDYVRIHGVPGQERIDKALKFLDEFNGGKSLSKIIVEKSFSKVLGEGAGKTAASALGPIGWINTAASVISAINKISTLNKWIFAVNSAAVVGFYMNYRTLADEVNSGTISPETLGGFVDALGSGVGASAEQSPLYRDYFVKDSTSGKIASFFSPHVLAEGEISNKYICNNGQSVDVVEGGNRKICPEDSLMTNNKLSDAANKVKSVPGFGPLSVVADGWNSTIGSAGGFTVSSIQRIPIIGDGIESGLGLLSNSTAKVTEPVMELVTESVAPPIIPDDIDSMSGAKNFTLLAAGANVAGNDFSHYGLGGQKLSDEEAFAIYEAVKKEENERFASLSINEKLFSTLENKSFISQLAMMVPFDGNSPTKMASILARVPLKTLSSTSRLISDISVKKVKAAEPYKDPFGIPQYGYPLNFNFEGIDPSTLTDKTCSQRDKDWLDEGMKVQDANNGTDTHNTVNVCRLNEAVVTSLGAVFGVIEKNSSPTSLTNGDTTSRPVQPVSDLNIVYGDTSDIPCKAGTDAGIGDGYSERQLYKIRLCEIRGILINSQISEQIDQIFKTAENSGLNIYAGASGYRDANNQIDTRRKNCADPYNTPPDQCSPPTALPGTSRHEIGLAIDFHCNGDWNGEKSAWFSDSNLFRCWQWFSDNVPKYGLKNLESEPWHWSVDGR